MGDFYSINGINESLLELISDLTGVSAICKDYAGEPTLEKGEKIVEIIDKSEKNMMKVKKNIVRMLKEMDDKDDVVEVVPLNDGFVL